MMWQDKIDKPGIWAGLSFMECDYCVDQAYIVENLNGNIYLNCTQLNKDIIDLNSYPYVFVKWKYLGVGNLDIFKGD